MATLQEVAVTSCLSESGVSVYVWDVQAGTTLKTYHGDCPVTRGGLSLLHSQYLVAALQGKPLLCVWPINSSLPLFTPRLLCPGKVSLALASPDNCYIALTVADRLHVYQVASGELVGSGARHFQPIRVLRWSGDGSSVVCGGEDGLVTVWQLAALTEPRHTLSDHTLPVTDLTLTAGSRPRIISVSADRTCKIYDLTQGTLLMSVVFDKLLTAVASSILDTELFVGTDCGAICQISLLSPHRHLEYHSTSEETASMFLGHSKAVRSLSASCNGALLMSGSSDGNVKVWHINSRQCLRTLTHKGPITNAFFAPRPKQMYEFELRPSVVIKAFRTANSEDVDCVEVISKHSMNLCNNAVPTLFPPAKDSSEARIIPLQREIDLLRSINSHLYKFSVDKVLTGNTLVASVKQVKNLTKTFVNEGFRRKKYCSTAVMSVNGLTQNRRKRKNKKKKANKID